MNTESTTHRRRRNTGRRYRNNNRSDYSRGKGKPYNKKKTGFSLLGFLKSLFGIKSKPAPAVKFEREERPKREAGVSGEQTSSSSRIQAMLETEPDVTTPKLYVGNLPYETSESDLFDMFAQVGSVKNVEIVRDRQSNSKGFGFVEMQTLETAKAAAEKLHRSEFMGRELVVSGAKV